MKIKAFLKSGALSFFLFCFSIGVWAEELPLAAPNIPIACQSNLENSPERHEIVSSEGKSLGYEKDRYEFLNEKPVVVHHRFHVAYVETKGVNDKGESVTHRHTYPQQLYPDLNWDTDIILGYLPGGHGYMFFRGKKFDGSKPSWLNREGLPICHNTYHIRIRVKDPQDIDRMVAAMESKKEEDKVHGLDCQDRMYYVMTRFGGIQFTPKNRVFTSNRFYDVVNNPILDSQGRELEKEISFLHPPGRKEVASEDFLKRYHLQLYRDERIIEKNESLKAFKMASLLGGDKFEAKMRELHTQDERGELQKTRREVMHELFVDSGNALKYLEKMDRIQRMLNGGRGNGHVAYLKEYLGVN